MSDFSLGLGAPVIRLDAFYFYQVGAAIRPLASIMHDTTKIVVLSRLYGAESWLEGLLGQGLIRIKTAAPKGRELLETIRRTREQLSSLTADQLGKQIGWESYVIQTQAEAFQTVLGAELSFGDIYVVSPKGGFDTSILAEDGIQIFPSTLPTKAPETIPDAKDAARCIAFELSTSAGFHLHRLNEAVLRRYYDFVTAGKPHPDRANIRKYIDAMKGYKVGHQVIFGALSALNNLHRNPLVHPEHRLETVEEAIALFGSVNSVVSYMLRFLPEQPLVLTPSPSLPSPEEIAAIEYKTEEQQHEEKIENEISDQTQPDPIR